MLTAENLPRSMTRFYLGAGSFGRVYSAGHRRVVKIARNDMARNWLEFCMWRLDSGQSTLLLPKVYSVVDYVQDNDAPDSYLAIMDQYEQQDRDSAHYAARWCGSKIIRIEGVEGFREVELAFSAYLRHAGWAASWSPFDDLHGGNIMLDQRRKGCKLVITDPSVGKYYRQSFIHNQQDALW